MFKMRDAILHLGHDHYPDIDWHGTGNFRFANPLLISQDSEAMMFNIKVDSKTAGHFSTDAKIIVRSVIGNRFTDDGKYRACNMNLDWMGNIPSSSFQPESCFVQLRDHHFDEVATCADLYCGGFGGWQHAADFLASQFDLPLRFLWAIDRDKTAAYCHSQNFGGTVYSEEVVENYPLPGDDKIVICGTCDYVLLNRVNFQIPTKGATASFPCPPWSRGSRGKGFDYIDGGLAILEILRAGIVNNWEFILLENVDAIIEHFHFAWIRTFIDDAGYYIAFSNISCISDISPAKRKRWVCIVLQKHLKARIPQHAFDWNLSAMPTLKSSKVFPAVLPEQHERDLSLSNDLLNIYGNPAFAPPGLKTRFTIEKRVKHCYEQMATATATYGRQHELPDEIIRTELQSSGKGIYADLVRGRFGLRFWSPIEIAMTLVFFKKTFFPLSLVDSHRFVGNAIRPMHAIKVFCAFLSGVYGKKIRCFEDIFRVALLNRLHMENSKITIQENWIVVEPIAFCIEDIQVSLTLPMPLSLLVVYGNQRRTIEMPMHSTIGHLLQRLGLSPDEFFVCWKPVHIKTESLDQTIPEEVDEIIIHEKFEVQEDLTSTDSIFVHKCIGRMKAIAIERSREPIRYPVHVYKDDAFCMTMHIPTCVKVQVVAEIGWNACNEVGHNVSCIHLIPPLNDNQSDIGCWGLSKDVRCEIRIITKKKREYTQFSLMTWDDTRKSPLLGQRIGEASHPGPMHSATIEFRFGDRKICFSRHDVNSRLSKHDIAARLGVSTTESNLWDPICQTFVSWDQMKSYTNSVCYVKKINCEGPPKKKKQSISFWDFLPTKMPTVNACIIDRKDDFSFGTIHRLTNKEVFDEQFRRIIESMTEQFNSASDRDLHSSYPHVCEHLSENLLWKRVDQTSEPHDANYHEKVDESHESERTNNHGFEKPKQAASQNKRCCKPGHERALYISARTHSTPPSESASESCAPISEPSGAPVLEPSGAPVLEPSGAAKNNSFWIHLPLGKRCVVVSADDCISISDLVLRAFERLTISNADYIIDGCYFMVNSKICDPQMNITSIPGTVIRVFLRGLRGGGKEEIMRSCSARLGELLIHKGLPINAVAAKVQKIIEKLGLSQVHQAMQNQSEIHAWRQVEQLAQSAGFVIFNEKEKKGLSATVIQRAIKKKKKGIFSGSSIAVDQFTLPLGIFINEDQSETPILTIDKLRAGAHGIVLTTEEKIAPWIQNGMKSSADELGAIFLGTPNAAIDDVYQPTPICFAAINHEGQECILRGTLLQLGSKKIQLNRHFKVEGANAAMTTCSLTAYASDFEQESFAKLISSPAKYMLAQLPSDTIRNAISSIWGRSFMRNGKKVPNLEADSVQMHISIKSNRVPDLLKCSGACNIYITPKTESGLFDPKYHLIWTDLSKIAIEQKSNEIQNHLGYIKGRKGFALRFLTEEAPDGFKILFPGKSFEPPVAVNVLYKLQPVSYGILPDVLIEACKAIKWNIKPIKRSGNSWLVGAEKQSLNKFLIIDGTTILVKEVEKTNIGKSPICLAGPRPKMMNKDQPDPFQTNDPWAGFKPSSGSSVPTGTPGHVAGASVLTTPSTNSRSTGPVEERFKSQESRIQKLEQKLDDTMQQMQMNQDDTKQELAKQQKEITDMKETFKSELIGLQKGITMSFQDSLKQAMQQQAQDMKKMFLESPPTGASPLKKQPKLGAA